MQDLFRHFHMSPELACRFLATFSRLEYALKSTSYVAGSENNVAPAWDRFANDIDEKFLAITRPDVVVARDYLLERAPRKQVLHDGTVAFVEQAIDLKQVKTQQVLLMVRTVRNNLFHGGEYCPEGEIEAGRNQLLVSNGLCLLLACAELHVDVRASFEN